MSVKWTDVWVSPDGLFYDGDAHENRAEEILEIMYGEVGVNWTGMEWDDIELNFYI